MTTQLAEAELVDPRMVQEAVGSPPVDYATEDDERNTAPRGIMTAILIAMPFWALIGFTIYLLT